MCLVIGAEGGVPLLDGEENTEVGVDAMFY